MNKTIIAGLVVIAAGAGVVLGLKGGLGGDDPGATLDGGTHIIPKDKRIEDVAPIAIVSATSGRKVFVVGEERPAISAVTDSALGKVVVKDTISEKALCNVVFEARLIEREITHPTGQKTKIKEPDFPVQFGHVQPVMISGSCIENSCLFNTLLHGQECLKAVDAAGYLGSTMNEFIALPLATQARFLKTEGLCTIKDPKGNDTERACTVNVGDPLATKNAKVFFAHSWAGRDDIKPLEAVWDGEKYTAEDRADKEMTSKGTPK